MSGSDFSVIITHSLECQQSEKSQSTNCFLNRIHFLWTLRADMLLHFADVWDLYARVQSKMLPAVKSWLHCLKACVTLDKFLIISMPLFLFQWNGANEAMVCSVVFDSAILWAVAHQAPLSMGFSRQEYWSGWPFPPLGDLPDPGIKPASPGSPVLVSGFFTTEPPGKPGNTYKGV